MFKSADPSSRIPAVLQANTKENIIFQLSLAAVFVGGMMVKDVLEERKLKKQRETYQLRDDLIG